MGYLNSRIFTGGPSGFAWGMNLHLPEPLKHQPWYTHCNLPHWSILPSDNGANRWGHLSSNTFQVSSFLSHHTTTSRPITFFACGLLLSRSQIGITGYHCEYQSNFSPWLWVSRAGSGGFVGFVETVDDMVLKTLNFDCFLWTNEKAELGVGLEWKFKNMGLLNLVLSSVVRMWKEGTAEAPRASMAASFTAQTKEKWETWDCSKLYYNGGLNLRPELLNIKSRKFY